MMRIWLNDDFTLISIYPLYFIMFQDKCEQIKIQFFVA